MILLGFITKKERLFLIEFNSEYQQIWLFISIFVKEIK